MPAAMGYGLGAAVPVFFLTSSPTCVTRKTASSAVGLLQQRL